MTDEHIRTVQSAWLESAAHQRHGSRRSVRYSRRRPLSSALPKSGCGPIRTLRLVSESGRSIEGNG